MRHSIAVKFILILLTALCLLTAVTGAIGVVVMANFGLYDSSLEEVQEQWLYDAAYFAAQNVGQVYFSKELGNCPEEIIESRFGRFTQSSAYNFTVDNYHAALYIDGQMHMEQGVAQPEGFRLEYVLRSSYLCASREDNGSGWNEMVYQNGWVTYWLDYQESPAYTVVLQLDISVLDDTMYMLISQLHPLRYAFIWMMGMGLLLFAVGLVVLCLCAGRTAQGAIRPGGLNRLPLDLYLALDSAIIILLVGLTNLILDHFRNQIHLGVLSMLSLLVLIACLVLTGFIFALAAQIKAKDGFWWRNSVIGFCLLKIGSLLKLLGRGILLGTRALGSFLRMIPVIGQWLILVYGGLGVTAITFVFGLISRDPWSTFWGLVCALALLGTLVLALYNGWCFGALLSGARQMAQGHLHKKIPTERMFGVFRDFALQLNSVSDAATLAAQNQMKSERMKTELITNVSHDIKTPLTSIINFVDLLQKPHTEQEGEEYLEVLSRQSARLKKLIEDLMEMSKANTGNITVNAEVLDPVETVNQALGEFADKLEAAKLIPIFRRPEEPMKILADGRLTWRVLSNVLSNAVKYALPGTRVYMELVQLEGEVLLSIKNISREELRVSAEELMERFVQGDASRNTEGSGLGLNIARSLMEVQHGQMNLLLDGDLFKVTLVFPTP